MRRALSLAVFAALIWPQVALVACERTAGPSAAAHGQSLAEQHQHDHDGGPCTLFMRCNSAMVDATRISVHEGPPAPPVTVPVAKNDALSAPGPLPDPPPPRLPA
jgi:hypothetical protein